MIPDVIPVFQRRCYGFTTDYLRLIYGHQIGITQPYNGIIMALREGLRRRAVARIQRAAWQTPMHTPCEHGAPAAPVMTSKEARLCKKSAVSTSVSYTPPASSAAPKVVRGNSSPGTNGSGGAVHSTVQGTRT